MINGFSEQLSKSLERLSPAEVQEASNAVLRNARSLNRLLTELFELAKLDGHLAELELQDFNLFQVLQDCIVAYAAQAKELELEFIDETLEDLPLVTGDLARIERVVTNLIENALRYTPAGGKIRISTQKSATDILVEVSDTEIGIAAENLPHIFDRFYRVESSKPRTGASTGLGLAIVKRIVEAHGSTMSVRSKVGEGTTFSFQLPIARSANLEHSQQLDQQH